MGLRGKRGRGRAAGIFSLAISLVLVVPNWPARALDCLYAPPGIDVGDGGPATAARLCFPSRVALDATGNIYIADTWHHRVRRVDPSGAITTVAGTGVEGFSGDGAPATQAQLSFPGGLAADGSAGALYVADIGNHRVRRISSSGIITTVAGTGVAGFSGYSGPATSMQLNYPVGLALGPDGSLYIADRANNVIRRVSSTGAMTTVAGDGWARYFGDGLPATLASLNNPTDVAVSAAGSGPTDELGRLRGNDVVLYIADSWNGRVRKVDATGVINTVAGGGVLNVTTIPKPALSVELEFPVAVAPEDSGSLLISDLDGQVVGRLDPLGLIQAAAGNGGYIACYEGECSHYGSYEGDGGPAIQAGLSDPAGVAVAPDGSFYIADSGNYRIRKVDPAGIITTVAGCGVC